MLTLVNCSNVTFENVSFKKKGADFYGTLALTKCKNVEFNNCDFSGWRFYSFSIDNSSSITFKNSKIHDSGEYGCLFWIYDCKKISFNNTEIFRIGLVEPHATMLGTIRHSSNIVLLACNIHDNGVAKKIDGNLFDEQQPTLEQCILSNNRY